MGLTKFVLRRPVTTILGVLCLLVFGISSVMSTPLEFTPEMNMPMMMVSTIYPGASPDDINELVTKPIEDNVGVLNGIKTASSLSSENVSIVMLEYEYGTDMDKAYSDLKKKVDNMSGVLPEDIQTPIIMEFNMNDQPTMTLSVDNSTSANIHNYVKNNIVPELEKLSSVASVDMSGGQAEYIRVELIPEKLKQYHLTMQNVASVVGSASFSFPAGSTEVGGQKLAVTAGVDYESLDRLKQIPITVNDGNVIYLQDVANVYSALEESSGIGRYNGKDTISLGIKKQQSSNAVDVSEDVRKTIDRLTANDPDLNVVVVDDTSDSILGSLRTVANTLVMAIAISMIIIFLFFGDLKASLIVGSSIPVSIMSALILMKVMGFSLNVITLSSLVLGVGMMVDNSIVVLESCFRSTKGKGFKEYMDAALKGSGIVMASIAGSTATTCVVFLPLALLEGMVGQMFRPLGFTIVFCMLASLISAMTIVPLCYNMYRPKEREQAPMSRIMDKMQNKYRALMKVILPKRAMVVSISILLLVVSVLMATQLRSEMIPADDRGAISINVEMRPGLTIEKADQILQQVEEIITQNPNLDSYMLTYGGSGISMGGSGATVMAYLKKDRTMETGEVLKSWKPILTSLEDCNITMSESSTMSMMGNTVEGVEIILESIQYDELKEVSDQIANALTERQDVTKVHSTLENAAPLVKIDVDPIKAAAEGLTPVQVASSINSMISGVEATNLDVNGEEIRVMVEYAPEEYQTIDQLKNILLATPAGTSVALTDIAEITFKDSPLSITRNNKQYQVTITGDYTEYADSDPIKMDQKIYDEVVSKLLNPNVSVVKNTMEEMMAEEFGSMYQAIAISIFLIFIVMAAQFESPRFSATVMLTIPFSLIGSFGLLFLMDATISLPSLIGFLMLVGTVVNNGILYVDTVGLYRQTMDFQEALIEAGATRLRPILMTTLTTVVSMIPMAMAFGSSGELLQGLALVNIGGLMASTILSLLMLPVFCSIINKRKKIIPALD